MDKNTVFILDAGHGGMINGEYVTPGKRSPIWKSGKQYFEGVGNRHIVNLVASKLDVLGVNYIKLVDSQEDVPLNTRIRNANDIYKNNKNVVYISIHSNAGGGTGFEAFSYKLGGISEKITQVFYNSMKKIFPDIRLRYDVDTKKTKTANFAVLKSTYMPATLLEFLFMDTEKDCEILMSTDGQNKIADVVVDGIKEIMKL